MSGPGASGAIILTFDVVGVETIERSFVTAGKVVDDLTPVWDAIATDLAADVAQNFASEGALFDFGFGGWDALADSTVRQRERLGYGGEGPIELRTGELRDSFQRGGVGNVTDLQPLGMVYGSLAFQAGWQNWGTNRMPPRPLLGMTQNRRALIVQKVGDYIRQRVAEQF